MTEDDQDLVATALASAPPAEVSPAFLARVNARIDAEADGGWLGVADFRSWTLRLAPVALALALLAVWWPASPAATTPPATTAAVEFTPASATDWQSDVNANALLEAALSGTANVR
jgi:hypothetical protein